MRYYIDKLHYQNPANKKLEQLVDFLRQYEHTLICGDYQELILSIEGEVFLLNEKFPKTKKIKVSVIEASELSESIKVLIENDPSTSDSYIAQMNLNPVKDSIYF